MFVWVTGIFAFVPQPLCNSGSPSELLRNAFATFHNQLSPLSSLDALFTFFFVLFVVHMIPIYLRNIFPPSQSPSQLVSLPSQLSSMSRFPDAFLLVPISFFSASVSPFRIPTPFLRFYPPLCFLLLPEFPYSSSSPIASPLHH